MSYNHETLTIDEAFREGGIHPDFLPSVIIKSNSNGKVKFVLSEKEDYYHTVSIHGCSCDQFASGVYPCSHQNRAWVVDVRKLAEREKRLEEEQEWLLKRKEEERLKKEEPEKYHALQEAKIYELVKSMVYVDEQFEQEQQEEKLKTQKEEKLKTQFSALLKEIEQNKKPGQAGSPKEKTRFYANTKKKIEKPIADMIDVIEEDQNYYNDLYF